MDNAGWRASVRAQRNSGFYENPQRGPDGHYEPVEQVHPISDGDNGGLNRSTPPTQPPRLQVPGFPSPELPELPPYPRSGPPTPPSKDGLPYYTNPNGAYVTQPTFGGRVSHQASVPSSYTPGGSLAGLSAIERSQYLRAVRMNPYLQLMVGPLLRYDTVDEQCIWHGACLIVSSDATSIYDPHPTLTYEWDPLVASEVRRSTSRATRERPSELGPYPADPHSCAALLDTNSSFRSSTSRSESVLGREIWVYENQRGHTFTFWKFTITLPLGQNEMCVRYTVNNGQTLEFYVPGRNQNMRWAAYSVTICNGFSAGVNSDDFRGPGFENGYDPVWADCKAFSEMSIKLDSDTIYPVVLNKHDQNPFHVLVGGGDQIYCDGEPEMQEWLHLSKPDQKLKYQITLEMRTAIDRFYFSHYCHIFQSGAFARATASIPMLNMADDHDLIDGFGSYPDDLQLSSVFSTIGSRGYFFFLLFQCFINVDVDGIDDRPGAHSNKSIIIGQRGPYVPFPSHSFLTYLGPNCSMFKQCFPLVFRAERRKDQVCSPYEYDKVFQKIYRLPSQVRHLVIQLGIPIAYPRMNFLESILESKFNPLVAMGKRGSTKVSGFVNKYNADAELLDDLNDHWTSKGHKVERNDFVLKLQEFAQKTHTRVTFLSGDVHCAAVGLFKTLVREKKANDIDPMIDHRFMLNVVTSAIVNTPPPNAVITLVTNRASKTHQTLHFADTDETMVPVFMRDTDGSTGKSKVVMGRRNYCIADCDASTGDLVFDIRVEKEKGYGTTVGYIIKAPPPRWQ
ncbi:hypothetical protein EW145_g2858 [Phellinidium pouzarii]|uniref:PhoD-like phosphatase domain-containing protein n=1 Tax=Phellinidium pouzarii TaxID=167371 RepID=A0A4S4L9H5_9AGAM|nr:hypothetical protein EW145_g2858 [Phellinidium pouzarii]